MTETISSVRRARAARVTHPVLYRHIITGPHPVRGDMIHEFSRAVKHFHPRYRTGMPSDYGRPVLVAPPAFSATILTPVLRDILLEFIPGGGPDRILHVDQVVEFRRPVVEGDRLRCRAAVESFRHFADYHVLAIKAALVDRQGAVKQTTTTSLLTRIGGDAAGVPELRGSDTHVRAAGSIHSRCTGTDPGAIAVGEPVIGSELPRWSVGLSRDDLTRYAHLTGATDITPSTIELGLVTTYLANAFGIGTGLTRLRTQAARHTHHLTLPCPDPATLEFHGYVTAVDVKHRRASVDISVRAGDRALFSYAAADLQLPD
ncbi:MaoC family dehydratase N-terminal domain-containing protein [Nocardia sp. NPDC005366]|uniref:FAS1-like dehydratase domain-containing protein n=1 Tax=Nocardia sp. NPDC005366 TaxID=3156878 RepID=UPI0033B371A0